MTKEIEKWKIQVEAVQVAMTTGKSSYKFPELFEETTEFCSGKVLI
jgi:hypothetical protein